jgi:pimeloyl-ACP methyl ester carboxylesterase
MLSALALLAIAAVPQAAAAGASPAVGGGAGRAATARQGSMTQTGTTPPRGAPLTTLPVLTPATLSAQPLPAPVLGAGPGVGAQAWQIKLPDPLGTGYDESFLLQVPPPGATAAAPAPLLVAFHAYGVSEKDITAHTTFAAECAARGWFLIAPLGATQVSYSSLESQAHVALVLDLAMLVFPGRIDPARIYGVGFSMGGGSALNYAARHLDPGRPMFAAVANHTGEVAHVDTYWNEPAAQWIFEHWFGGPPPGQEFEYLRSSLYDFDPSTLVVNQTTDLARNLTHVPVRSTYVPLDPVKYLLKQTTVLHQQLLARGGSSELVVLSGFGHTWGTLNEAQTCDWLAQRALTLPSAAETLADHDGRYFAFDVEQDAPGAFTPFTWHADAGANRLSVSATANLARLGVATAELGLDTAQPLEVALATADGLADEIGLAGYATAPSQVLRDGAPAIWSFAGDAVVLHETDGGAHTWLVVP